MTGVLDRGAFTGKEAIRGALSPAVEATQDEAFGGGRLFLQHNLTTRRIEFPSDTTADVWTYFLVMTPIGMDRSGVYVDRFVKCQGRWLNARPRVEIDWRAATPTIL
jgi:hypothetical protein